MYYFLIFGYTFIGIKFQLLNWFYFSKFNLNKIIN